MVTVLNKNPSFGELMGRALGQGLTSVGEGLVAGRQNRKENERLKSLLGQEADLSGLSPDLKSTFAQAMLKNQQELQLRQKMAQVLMERGVSPEDASLYSQLTTGGQTQFAKDLLEARRRGGGLQAPGQKNIQALTPEVQAEERVSPEEGMVEEKITVKPPKQEKEGLSSEIEFIKQNQDVGLTPSERVKRESERFKLNQPVYQEATEKLHTFARDKERIGLLESIDKTGKLPKGMARINVDGSGNLRLPFAATPEAERFVKTLNEFSIGAKDTFGSRVTNFDLSQYMRRYPTLMNSAEGRKQLYEQMRIVNDINSVYYKNLKNVYEKAGGVRRIDPDQASMLAEKMSEKKIEELSEKFNKIGSFPTLPSPTEHEGKTIRNKKTGEVFRSNGKEWLPVE